MSVIGGKGEELIQGSGKNSSFSTAPWFALSLPARLHKCMFPPSLPVEASELGDIQALFMQLRAFDARCKILITVCLMETGHLTIFVRVHTYDSLIILELVDTKPAFICSYSILVFYFFAMPPTTVPPLCFKWDKVASALCSTPILLFFCVSFCPLQLTSPPPTLPPPPLSLIY